MHWLQCVLNKLLGQWIFNSCEGLFVTPFFKGLHMAYTCLRCGKLVAKYLNKPMRYISLLVWYSFVYNCANLRLFHNVMIIYYVTISHSRNLTCSCIDFDCCQSFTDNLYIKHWCPDCYFMDVYLQSPGICEYSWQSFDLHSSTS